MEKSLKRAVALTVLGLTLVVSPSLKAESVAMTLADWEAAGSFALGDKLFTFTSASDHLPTGGTVTFIHSGLEYALIYAYPTDSGNGASDTLLYTIAITNPNHYFKQVTIDSTAAGSGVSTVVKTGEFGTITSTSGSTGSSGDISASHYSLLHVTDTITTDLAEVVSSFKNGFLQYDVTVPEPASLALFGLGVGGLAVRTWRKRRSGR